MTDPDRTDAPAADSGGHPSSEIVFMGTGTSEGVPRVSCLTREPPTCRVCLSAVLPGSMNRRRNTSLLIRYAHPDGRERNIVIDVGKSFWESAVEWFFKYRVPTIDAVLLTHAHADAVGGLDSLRDWTAGRAEPMPVYLRAEDLEAVAKMHFYLVDPEASTGGGGVAQLEFRTIDESPLDVQGVRFTPLPVWHGRPVSAHGFRFGAVSYMSDVSEIPAGTERLLAGTEVLILDALRPDGRHPSHFIMEESLEIVRRVRPARTLLTGMTHGFDHDSANAGLAKLCESEGLDVQLAHDGLRAAVEL